MGFAAKVIFRRHQETLRCSFSYEVISEIEPVTVKCYFELQLFFILNQEQKINGAHVAVYPIRAP